MTTSGPSSTDTFDPRDAKALLEATDSETRRALDVRGDLLFTAWGVAWVVGYLSIWWSTRGQDPYTGPAGWAYGILSVALLAAAGVTVVVITRASAGISGASTRVGTFYGLSWAVGFLLWQSVMGAVARAGVPDDVAGLLGAAGPALIVAVIYCVSAALWEDASFFVAGCVLAVATGLGVWTGPSTASLVIGVVGGIGFATAAGLSRRGRV